MTISLEEKKRVIEEYRINDLDTGSPEVQIAIMSVRIKNLTEHLKVHKTDFACRRGLFMLIGLRNRLLAYLKNNDKDRYLSIIKRLGLRK